MPPHHTGMPFVAQKSWMAIDDANPPPGLDVDDATAAERHHVARAIHRGDRFVETDRRGKAALQLGVLHEIVEGERLLDHHETEGIELRQVIGVRQGIGIVRVGHERCRGAEGRANGSHVGHIGAGRDLDLHLAVT
jgi:hypothetical protein